jgi:hypothetical protein
MLSGGTTDSLLRYQINQRVSSLVKVLSHPLVSRIFEKIRFAMMNHETNRAPVCEVLFLSEQAPNVRLP